MNANAEEQDNEAPTGRNVPCPCGSGKKFKRCCGDKSAAAAQQPLVMASSTTGLKLDLGAGQSPREGFEGVDIWPSAKHVVNLFRFPWPFEDNSVDELHCSHFVEHIPARDIEERDLVYPSGLTVKLKEGETLVAASSSAVSTTQLADARTSNDAIRAEYLGKDMLFAFFDECWRILKKEAWMTVITPALQSTRAFQDPTHRRFIPAEMFLYLNREWRTANKLDHYRVRCHFLGNATPTVPQEFNVLHPEAQGKRMREGWNIMVDFHTKMQASK